MGILEQLMQMKNQGIPEKEIISQLRKQGSSPKEINDALNQSRIKNAVSNDPMNEGMESSIMEQPPEPPKPQYSREHIKTQELSEEDLYTPQPKEPENFQEPIPPKIQEFPEQETYNTRDPQEQPLRPSQEFYPQEGYGEYVENTNMADTSTMLEISEQVFSEKIKKFQKQLTSLNEFQALSKIKLENISSRLKRMETSFDQLQIAILQKVGTYGKNLETTQKEMNMMQDSFRKMVNPLVNKTASKRKIIHKKPVKRKISRKK